MRIRCAAVDDNQTDLEHIRNVFDMLSYGTELIFNNQYFSNPDDLDLMEPYDIYILDIDMPQVNGFSLTRKIYDVFPDAVIVFCTSHEDLVFDSFRLNTFYFVRKSFLESDLRLALQKFINGRNSRENHYVYQSSDCVRRIAYSQIVYFEVLKNDLFIHTYTEEFRERKSMKILMDEISDDMFIPISQNYLVNARYIVSIDDHFVILNSGARIAIPKRNEKNVKGQYVKYLMRQL